MTTPGKRLLTTLGIAIFSCSFYLCEAKAQSVAETDSLLIAQTLGGIERDITLSEVPNPALASATAVAGAVPNAANVELQPDGSLVYELAGQNQQGFQFIVDVNSEGKIIEVDEEVDPTAVPEVVYRALNRWAPGAQIESTWRSTRLGEFVYEIVLDEFWFEIKADGRTLTIHQN
ncbi:MAG: hypothetical protein F6K31_25090 [Symploca sp. SIO2G7]|nr:hypothetical protein [Symploca sp. SIO2G7]